MKPCLPSLIIVPLITDSWITKILWNQTLVSGEGPLYFISIPKQVSPFSFPANWSGEYRLANILAGRIGRLVYPWCPTSVYSVCSLAFVKVLRGVAGQKWRWLATGPNRWGLGWLLLLPLWIVVEPPSLESPPQPLLLAVQCPAIMGRMEARIQIPISLDNLFIIFFFF